MKMNKLLIRCKKRCQNKNRKLKKFCKKCLSLVILDENKTFKSNKISENNIFFEDKNPSLILLSNSTKFDYNMIENLIVFGDSHSSVGTNFTDMSYTGWNFSGGKNWPLYLIDFNNIKLWNYAARGAYINKKFSKFVNNIDLEKQYSYYYENMSKGKQFSNVWNKYNSLYVFWFGTCDIGWRIKGTNLEIIENLFNVIKRIYDIGARNILILGAPPLYRIPNRKSYNKCKDVSDDDCIEILKKEVSQFNNEIIKISKIFFKKYSKVNLIYYSTVNIFEDIIKNCYEYGFKECINSWGGNKKKNVSDYFWANSHISDPAKKILSENINELLNSLSK
ncbi:hypothetical protein H8356DRAFT_1435713 [Neocallimastix lanati (nom. inval.)]|nr:hypothetical protein H8356DRAFT_1435713 [Neocallimastix sp. JGI-2020a]